MNNIRHWLRLAMAAVVVVLAISCGSKPAHKSSNVEEEPVAEPAPEPAPAPEPVSVVMPLPEPDDEPAPKKRKGKAPKEEEFDEDEGGDFGEPTIIHFLYASHKIDQAGLNALKPLVAQLKRDRSSKIHIVGYTCNISSETTNMRVSQRRAEAVADYFKQNGIAAKRLTIEAVGSQKPMVPNTSDSNRAKNRRVEITIEE